MGCETISHLEWAMRSALRCLTLVLLFSGGCAPLNTFTMSSNCRDAYNICLDGCRPPIRTSQKDWDTQTPACVDQCNQQAKSCSG